MVCGGEVVCLCDAAAVTSGSKSQVRVFVSFFLTNSVEIYALATGRTSDMAWQNAYRVHRDKYNSVWVADGGREGGGS